MARLLDFCRKHDLKAIIPVDVHPTKQLPEDKVCWGYFLKDEPTVDEFPPLSKQANEIREAKP